VSGARASPLVAQLGCAHVARHRNSAGRREGVVA
jgi:hypothetical protein